MKPSEITVKDVALYLRLDYDNMTKQEIAELSAILASTKEFIKNYTGLTDSEIDQHQDLSMVVMGKCQMQYDNRGDLVDNDKINPFFKSVLDLYSVNFL
jgi:hypothetical protein